MDDIPKGYKITEIGVIPEDWEVLSLNDIGTFSKGRGISRSEAYSGNIPCVRYGEIYTHHNDYIRSFNSRISKYVAKASKKMVKGDLLFSGSGETKEEIGKCVAFLDNVEAYAGGDIVILSPNKGNSLYFGYLLNSPFIVKQKSSRGQGDAIVHISGNSLSKIVIPYPEEEEQKQIGLTLSDIDALITSLEKLIEKKKLIKQGVMQELLTGKRRLKGFSGEWKKVKLKDVLSYEQPTEYIVKSSKYQTKGKYPVLTAGKTFILGYTNEIDGIFTEIPVIIFDDFTTASKYVDFCFKVKSSAMKMLKPRSKNIDLRFIYEKMQLIDFVLGDHKRYWISEYSEIEIDIPEYNEQTAIANILSDLDLEIEKLKTKHSKLKTIKAGAMQQLLTGKIRLI